MWIGISTLWFVIFKRLQKKTWKGNVKFLMEVETSIKKSVQDVLFKRNSYLSPRAGEVKEGRAQLHQRQWNYSSWCQILHGVMPTSHKHFASALKQPAAFAYSCFLFIPVWLLCGWAAAQINSYRSHFTPVPWHPRRQNLSFLWRLFALRSRCLFQKAACWSSLLFTGKYPVIHNFIMLIPEATGSRWLLLSSSFFLSPSAALLQTLLCF